MRTLILLAALTLPFAAHAQRPEGSVNYTDQTPIADQSGNPVTCLAPSANKAERYRWPCLIHIVGPDDFGLFDADGNRQGGGTKLRNVRAQAQCEIMGVAGVYKLCSEALTIAADRARVSGRLVPVVENIVGDKGRVVSSKVLG